MATKPASKKEYHHHHKSAIENFRDNLPLYFEQTGQWLSANLKQVGIGIAVVAVVMGISYTWMNYTRNTQQKALALEAAAFKLHQTVQEERSSAASQTTEDETSQQPAASYQKVTEAYQELREDYSGTESAARALYMLGSVEYEQGNYDKAREYFSYYRQQHPKGSMILEAEQSLAYILEQQGQYADAIQRFKSLESKISSTRKAEMQLAIARNYVALKNIDDAVAMYQTIIDSNTAAAWKNTAREQLEILSPQPIILPSVQTSETKSDAETLPVEATTEAAPEETEEQPQEAQPTEATTEPVSEVTEEQPQEAQPSEAITEVAPVITEDLPQEAQPTEAITEPVSEVTEEQPQETQPTEAITEVAPVLTEELPQEVQPAEATTEEPASDDATAQETVSEPTEQEAPSESEDTSTTQ